MYSFIILCLCNFSRARFFIIDSSSSVNLVCFDISGPVGDSNIINDCSCLTSSDVEANIVPFI